MEFAIGVIAFLFTVYIFPFAASRWVKEWDRLLKAVKEIEPSKPKVIETTTPVEDRMNKDLETTAKKAEEAIPAAAWVGSPAPDVEIQKIEAEAMKREREARATLIPPTAVNE